MTDVTALARALERAAGKPLVVVGSGGSYSVATYCSGLHRQATGQVSRPMTPLTLAGAGESLDAGMLCVSASGSNVDIKSAFTAGARRELRPAIAFALEEGSPLSELAAEFGYPDSIAGPRPAVPDGFLAVNSVLVTCLIFARAYRKVAGRTAAFASSYEEFLERTGARPYEVSDQVAALCGEQTLSVMFSPDLEAAAVDLESRFVEAALGHLHIADYRNFGHGRGERDRGHCARL
jgi:fructoselysine-6-P-deglycase FrlB-like protein